MSKSVLIMNTPKGCFACPFHMADFNFNLCLATRNDSIRTISKVSHEGFKKTGRKTRMVSTERIARKIGSKHT